MSTNLKGTLKYTIIKSGSQYNEYCNILEDLVDKEETDAINDEIDLLTLLIEKWDEEHNSFSESNPVELIQYLMQENNLKAKDLAATLNVSKGLISDILHYKKGLSKQMIRSLSEKFKVSQAAFNRTYSLTSNANARGGEAV